MSAKLLRALKQAGTDNDRRREKELDNPKKQNP